MPSKTRSGRTPQKVSSSCVTSDVPVKKRKLSKMIIPSEVEEEEEEEEEEVELSFIKRTKVANARAHKVIKGSIFKGA